MPLVYLNLHLQLQPASLNKVLWLVYEFHRKSLAFLHRYGIFGCYGNGDIVL